MTPNALTFESDIRQLIALGDLDGALAFIRFLVDHVRFDPAAMGVTLGSPALDRLCGEIGAATLAHARQAALATASCIAPDQHPHVIILATELYPVGGHSRVIADIIATRPDKQHLILVSNFFDSADRVAAEQLNAHNAKVAIAPQTPAPGRLDKLLWLQTELARHPHAQVFVFNHHGDAATIAAIQPGLNREVIFYHHADYHLCLGAHLGWTRHVDFFPPCHHRCSEAGISAEYWPLSVPDRGARPLEPTSFCQGNQLRSCTSGVWSKFNDPYPFHYSDVIVDILRATQGRHLHIGGIPDEALARIHANLAAHGIAAERFEYVAQVPSVWDALIAQQIDLYISSFPLGGGRAITEALGAGVPLITHRHHLEPLLGASGLGPPGTRSWSTPQELVDILDCLTPELLARHARAAREHYVQHHSPATFQRCVQTGHSAPLPAHEAQPHDRLLSYLLRSTVRNESHAPVLEELTKRLQAVSTHQAGTPTHSANSLAHAISLYEQGLLEEAYLALMPMLEHHPVEPDTLIYLGLIALKSNLPDDAANFFDHARTLSDNAAGTQAQIDALCRQQGPVPGPKVPQRTRIAFLIARLDHTCPTGGLQRLLCELDPAQFETLLFIDGVADPAAAQRFVLIADHCQPLALHDADAASVAVRAQHPDVIIAIDPQHQRLPQGLAALELTWEQLAAQPDTEAIARVFGRGSLED